MGGLADPGSSHPESQGSPCPSTQLAVHLACPRRPSSSPSSPCWWRSAGQGYALAALPKHSVGPAQLKKNAVTSKAVKNHALKAKDLQVGVLPPSDVFIKYLGDDGVPVTALVGAGADTVIRSMSLPAGTYYVRATGLG